MGCCCSQSGEKCEPATETHVRPSQGNVEAKPRLRGPSSSICPARVTEKIEKADRIKILNLSEEGLHAIPSAVSKLEGLKALDVSSNVITVLPDVMCSSASLRKFHAAHNRLASWSDTLQLPALQVLDVSYNSIGKAPDCSGMMSLRELDLSHNRLSALNGDLPVSLVTLKLRGNVFANTPAAVFALRNLSTLDLAANMLEGLGSPDDVCLFARMQACTPMFSHALQVAKLQSLKSLDVSNNRIQSLPASLFEDTTLNALQLGGNTVTEADLKMMPCYEVWLSRRASTINKKLQGGATYDLIR